MISLKVSHIILVMTSALLTLAWSTHHPIILMFAVACHILAGQIVAQSTER